MFKKILVFISIFITNAYFIAITHAATREVWNGTIKNVLLWITENDIWPGDDNWLYALDSIFVWIKDSLTWLIVLTAVWAFLFIWIRVAMARWNPEEFKKSIIQLVYVIVWIFVVSLAWAAVTLVSWLNI